jgi:hypothetical protein
VGEASPRLQGPCHLRPPLACAFAAPDDGA